jgi:2-keto-4-pentenoate hydratase
VIHRAFASPVPTRSPKNGAPVGFVFADEMCASEDKSMFDWKMARDGRKPHDFSGSAVSAMILKDFHWLTGKAIAIGAPLQEGEIILSGSLGGAIPVVPGDTLSARIAGLGECQVSFR